MTIAWEAAGGTDVGQVRRGNEDTFRLDAARGIFLVADGMGGHAAGEVASRLAADAVADVLSADGADIEESLIAAFDEAHRRIAECCAGDPRTRGMGTTLTTAALTPTGDLYIAHIGDSRMYVLRGAELRQVTHDHTWVQQEIDAGRIEAADGPSHPLGHILSRVLTADEPAEPDIYHGNVLPGDTLLLCSDGLYNMVDAQSLVDSLAGQSSVGEIVERLLAAANRGGGQDNITAIVVRIR